MKIAGGRHKDKADVETRFEQECHETNSSNRIRLSPLTLHSPLASRPETSHRSSRIRISRFVVFYNQTRPQRRLERIHESIKLAPTRQSDYSSASIGK